jgi:hypothetical protein
MEKRCIGSSIIYCGTHLVQCARDSGGGLWATRKLLVAVAGSALLTWWERIEHHPPDLAIVELVHFFFVFAVIALLVYIGQWRKRNSKKSLSE